MKLDNDHRKRWQPMSCIRVVVIGYGKTASRTSEIGYMYCRSLYLPFIMNQSIVKSAHPLPITAAHSKPT